MIRPACKGRQPSVKSAFSPSGLARIEERMNASSSHSRLEFGSGAWIDRDALRFDFSRASGPGGQAVNKISSRAQLHVAVSDIRGLDEHAEARLRRAAGRRLTQDDELVFQAQTHRSQHDNKQECIDRLRQLVAAALVRPKMRKKSKPTRGMIERRLESKRRQSHKKNLRRGRDHE